MDTATLIGQHATYCGRVWTITDVTTPPGITNPTRATFARLDRELSDIPSTLPTTLLVPVRDLTVLDGFGALVTFLANAWFAVINHGEQRERDLVDCGAEHPAFDHSTHVAPLHGERFKAGTTVVTHHADIGGTTFALPVAVA